MCGYRYQPGEARSEEDPENTAQDGCVLRQICGAQIQQYTVETKSHAIEAILAIERGICERLDRQLGSEQHVGANAKRQVQHTNHEEQRRSQLEDGNERSQRDILVERVTQSCGYRRLVATINAMVGSAPTSG